MPHYEEVLVILDHIKAKKKKIMMPGLFSCFKSSPLQCSLNLINYLAAFLSLLCIIEC
jgi:hypothetical protein